MKQWKRDMYHLKKETGVKSLEFFTSSLNLIFRKRCNPQTPLDNTLDGLKPILRAGINQTKQTFDNARRCAVALEIDQGASLVALDLSGFLGVISEVMDIET